MKESVESLMSVKTKDLKNCTKEMVVEYHDKTIYDCRNVTKRHCTTLWTINEEGQKVLIPRLARAEVTACPGVGGQRGRLQGRHLGGVQPRGEEGAHGRGPDGLPGHAGRRQLWCTHCYSLHQVSYFDYENTTTLQMADTMDCTVEKRPVRIFLNCLWPPSCQVCEPVTTKKCAETSYTRCEEVRGGMIALCLIKPWVQG